MRSEVEVFNRRDAKRKGSRAIFVGYSEIAPIDDVHSDYHIRTRESAMYDLQIWKMKASQNDKIYEVLRNIYGAATDMVYLRKTLSR